MTTKILCLPVVVQDLIWEYDGRYKAFITQTLIKNGCRNMKYRTQEHCITDANYKQFLYFYYGKNLHFDDWSRLPFFETISKNNDSTYDYQIILYPLEKEHRKFIILPRNIEIDISILETYNKYTGWLCTERQQQQSMDKYNPGWDKNGEIFINEFDCLSYVDFLKNSFNVSFKTDNRNFFCMLHNNEMNLSIYVEDTPLKI